MENPDDGHGDGPYALPGRSNLLGLPVVTPDTFSGEIDSGTGFWAAADSCGFTHLHGNWPGRLTAPPIGHQRLRREAR